MFKDTTIEDLTTILKNTLIRFEERPVIVSEITWEYNLLLLDCLNGGVIQEIPVEDERLNYEPVPLGMVESNNRCVYVSRLPSRQYRQGLHQDNIHIVNVDQQYMIDRGEVSSIRRMTHKGLLNCVINQYAPINAVLDAVFDKEYEEGVVFKAVSRLFAINNNGSIFFKDKNVGVFNIDNGKPTFLNNYRYLNYLWGDLHAG